MEFFATNAQLHAVELALAGSPANARLPLLLQLAWHLRQRDTQRALQLVTEIHALLATSGLDATAHQAIQLRLLLIEGEAQWLYAQLDAASSSAQQALQGFTALHDATGCADALWLQAMILHVQGQMAQRNQTMQQMLTVLAAQNSEHNALRADLVMLTMATDEVFVAGDAVRQRIEQRFPIPEQCHLALQSRLAFFHGICHGQQNRHPQAASCFMQAYDMAIESGQVFYALFAKGNVGYAFIVLNEAQTALEWLQQALELARNCGWPVCLGMSLFQTAELLRQMQRFDAARELFNQALDCLRIFPTSRNYAITLGYLGNLELDCGNHAAAMENFNQLNAIAAHLQHPELRARANCGRARVLAAGQQKQAAIDAAQDVLDNPVANLRDKISVLQVLAGLHRPTMPYRQDDGTNPTLHYLHQALDYAQTLDGYTTSVELLDALADEYAALGQHEQAYDYLLQAKQARQQIHSHIAQNRALALQLKHQTDSIRLENERQRQLAESEAKRAEILQQTSATLARLGTIGQEITAHLDVEKIFAVLQRHIHALLDVVTLQVFFVSADGLSLQCVLGAETTEPASNLFLHDNPAPLARAARECCDIILNKDSADAAGSQMLVPLKVGAGKLLGVMQIHTDTPFAYGEQQQLVFHTLCTYAAIALANAQAHASLASAHASLQQSQQHLVLQEKMASLGTLTAGVAHEINNPTNFAHVSAQALQMDISRFTEFVTTLAGGEHADPVLMAEFDERFRRLHEHVNTILRGTARITNIVKDLRVFTRLDEAAKKSVHLSQCLQSMLNLVRTNWQERVRFVTEFDDDPEYECWPALLNQVFLNLATNACQAIARRSEPNYPGQLHILMRINHGQLWISFSDNGIGITAETQAAIMQGNDSLGLGLAIARDIVKQHAGQLLLQSEWGKGSCFTLCLPLMR